MSIQWMSSGWTDGPPSPIHRYVYLALADNANQDGVCWPSLPRIAEKTRYSLATVKRAIRSLVKDGWVERIVVGQGAGRRSEYQLKTNPDTLENGVTQTPFSDTSKPRAKKGVTQTPKKGSHRPLKRGHTDPSPTPPIRKNRQLTVIEPSGERSGFAAARAAQAPGKAPSKSATHREPTRKAALRRSPTSPPDPLQTALPITEASATQPAPVSSRNSGPLEEGKNAVYPPRDPRFDKIANGIRKEYWFERRFGPCPWGVGERSALSMLLADNPELDEERFKEMFRNRAASVKAGEYNPSEAPRFWLRKLPNFASGPLTRFGDPLKVERPAY